MNNETYRSLDDVFKDPEFTLIVGNPLEKQKIQHLNPDIEKFKEIVSWVEENGREPKKTPGLSKERTLFSRLKGIRNDDNRIEALRPFDTVGILPVSDSKNATPATDAVATIVPIESIDDVFADMAGLLGDDPLGGLVDVDGFFDTSKVKKPERPDEVGKRVPSKEFSIYEPLFKKVQSELASGARKLIPFKNYEVLPHHYYVYNGVLGYIESISDEFTRTDGRKNAHMRIIYENGTEADILTLGFAASMYGKRGRIVTELEEDYTFIPDEENVVTGYIYVLRSKSANPDITGIKNLYKIGFTEVDVNKRISNAENESTYLYAPVEVVTQFAVVNVNARSVETALHHALNDFQLQVEIAGPNGKMITPREWFVIPFEDIKLTIEKLIASLSY